MKGGRPRPRRPVVPVGGTLVALVAWEVVAHESGVGWVQAVGALVAGVAAVGLVMPAFIVGRARCSATFAPADAVAGQPATVIITATTPVEILPVDPPGPVAVTGSSSSCPIELRLDHRGVIDHCTVVVASAAPFGLLWWSRTLELALARPMVVAPRTGTPDRSGVGFGGLGDDAPSSFVGNHGEPRSVRPYERGDRRHLVHWPATAHAGTLMVREMDRPGARRATVMAVLPDDLAAAELTAERTMGTVGELLATGAAVDLVTVEVGGEVRAPVGSSTEAGRRLARAVPHWPPVTSRPTLPGRRRSHGSKTKQ